MGDPAPAGEPSSRILTHDRPYEIGPRSQLLVQLGRWKVAGRVPGRGRTGVLGEVGGCGTGGGTRTVTEIWSALRDQMMEVSPYGVRWLADAEESPPRGGAGRGCGGGGGLAGHGRWEEQRRGRGVARTPTRDAGGKVLKPWLRFERRR